MNDNNGFPTYEQQMIPQMPAGIQPINAATGMSDTIASMRWESDPMIVNIRIRLGGYVPTATQDGQTLLQRPDGVTPMVNDVGIDRFIAVISGVVNPTVALTNIDDEEANTLIRQILYSIVFDMVYNKDRFAIHDGDMRTVLSVMKSIVFNQLKRPVSGHEAKNFRTQTVEQSLNQNMNAGQQKTGLFNPMGMFRGGR